MVQHVVYGVTAITSTTPMSPTTGLHYIVAVGQNSHAVSIGGFLVHS